MPRSQWLPWAIRERKPDAPFATDATSLGHVLGLAAAIADLGPKASVCVGSDDRVEVAAALLSAFAGGPRVVFPHALTPGALRDVAAAQPYDFWLGPEPWGTELEARRFETTNAPPVDSYALRDTDAPTVSLFTGGSTGRPKLWTKAGRHLLGEAAMLSEAYGVGPTDRVLSTAPPNHIYGILFSVLVPLLSGAPVQRAATFFPAEAMQLTETTGATILVTTPVHVRALLAAKWRRHSTRLLFTSGAPLSPADARALHDEAGIGPVEVYGSTETGGIAARAWEDASRDWKALAGVAWRLVDGVLAVRSPYVSDEAPRDADGYYHTADTARDVGAGRFELAGRADGVVKVGARRVDLREIEDRLRAMPGVRDAVVVARPSRSGRDAEIVALVESARPAADLSVALRSALPSPAWPRIVRCVERIPTTAAGKRDLEGVERLIEEAPA
jgi:acyl-coenzyme A synthetase/AMP-(fatty) acid ligase